MLLHKGFSFWISVIAAGHDADLEQFSMHLQGLNGCHAKNIN
jgi:hypothetical protein